MTPLTQQHNVGPETTAFPSESGYIHEINGQSRTVTHKPMNIPGNPTENPVESRIAELQAEVIACNESIATQKHIIWLAGVEIARKKKSLAAALASIETLEKGPEA